MFRRSLELLTVERKRRLWGFLRKRQVRRLRAEFMRQSAAATPLRGRRYPTSVISHDSTHQPTKIYFEFHEARQGREDDQIYLDMIEDVKSYVSGERFLRLKVIFADLDAMEKEWKPVLVQKAVEVLEEIHDSEMEAFASPPLRFHSPVFGKAGAEDDLLRRVLPPASSPHAYAVGYQADGPALAAELSRFHQRLRDALEQAQRSQGYQLLTDEELTQYHAKPEVEYDFGPGYEVLPSLPGGSTSVTSAAGSAAGSSSSSSAQQQQQQQQQAPGTLQKLKFAFQDAMRKYI